MISGYEATASLLSEVNGTQTEAIWMKRTMAPAGSAPRDCWSPYFFQSVVTTERVIAHADCWYWSGARFAKRHRSTSSSPGSGAPYASPTSTWKGLPRYTAGERVDEA